MNTRHTPGPWKWADDACYSLRPAHGDPNAIYRTLLEVESHGMVRRDCDITAMNAEGAANMTLIACAPELLDALVLAERFMAGFEDDEAQIGIGITLAIIRAAINKASGGTA